MNNNKTTVELFNEIEVKAVPGTVFFTRDQSFILLNGKFENNIEGFKHDGSIKRIKAEAYCISDNKQGALFVICFPKINHNDGKGCYLHFSGNDSPNNSFDYDRQKIRKIIF